MNPKSTIDPKGTGSARAYVQHAPEPDSINECRNAAKRGCKDLDGEQLGTILCETSSRAGRVISDEFALELGQMVLEYMDRGNLSPCVACGLLAARAHLAIGLAAGTEMALALYSFADGPHFTLKASTERLVAGLDTLDRKVAVEFLSKMLSKKSHRILADVAKRPRGEIVAFRHLFGLLGWLAKHESAAPQLFDDVIVHMDKVQLYRLTVGVDALLLGTSMKQLRQSVRSVGPLLNDLDADGCPIPGSRPLYASKARGWDSIRGVLVERGKIQFYGERAAEGRAGLVSDDDLSIAMMLAFGDPAGPIEPWFSLEQTGARYGASLLDEKQFGPAFMAHTDFGQSMYLADYLIKNFMDDGGVQSLTDPLFSSSMVPGGSRCVIPGMRDVGGETPEDMDCARVCWQLEGIDVHRDTVSRWLGFRKMARYELTNIRYYVASSYVQGTDRNIRPNDPATRIGASARLLTESFEYAAAQFPVLARVRQLMAVTRLLFHLRETDVRLHPRVQARLSKALVQWQKLNTTKEFHPMPFMPDRFQYVGGVSMHGSEAQVTDGSRSGYAGGGGGGIPWGRFGLPEKPEKFPVTWERKYPETCTPNWIKVKIYRDGLMDILHGRQGDAEHGHSIITPEGNAAFSRTRLGHVVFNDHQSHKREK